MIPYPPIRSIDIRLYLTSHPPNSQPTLSAYGSQNVYTARLSHATADCDGAGDFHTGCKCVASVIGCPM